MKKQSYKKRDGRPRRGSSAGSRKRSYKKREDRYKRSTTSANRNAAYKKRDRRFETAEGSSRRKRSYGDRDGQSRRSSRPYNKRRSGGFNHSGRGGSRGRFGGRSHGRSKYKFKSIDITTFIKKAQAESKETKTFTIQNTFDDFAFAPEIKKNLHHMKFVTPTPIQDASMVHIMAGEDVIGLANTGTGKTGAFLLPMLHKVLADPTQRVLIIAPTRELVIQIDDEFRRFAYGTKIKSATIIGGVSPHKQVYRLKQRPNFVIGTPGRLKDLCDQKKLKLRFFNNVVLDEVDRMLDMGFLPTVKELLAQTRETRQSLFFSATMPPEIRKLAEEFLNNPEVVERQAGRTTANVSQEIVNINEPSQKFAELQKILCNETKAIVFSETKRGVDKLTRLLTQHGYKADCIHGNKSQNKRQRALKAFKTHRVDILVATDVAARGLDIKGVNTVVNYTVPQTYDDYVHRIGRTGRANTKGRAITFVGGGFN